MIAELWAGTLRIQSTILLLAALAFPLSAMPQKEKTSPPAVIHISYADSFFNLQIMIMRERRMLENAFEPKGIAVRWHAINSGDSQIRAMDEGTLDIASVIHSAPVIIANASGRRVEIAALVSRPRQNFALVVGANGPRTIKELNGKTVAGPKGTILYQMLNAALAAEGMSVSDIRFIQMGLPEAAAALLSGQTDAALQTAGFILRDEEAGARVLFTADGYITPLFFTAVRPDFAKRQPDILRLYLDIQAEAYDWIAAHPHEAVALGSRYQKISLEDGIKLFEWSGIASVMDVEDLPAMRADVDFLYNQGMIGVKIQPEDFIRPSTYSR